MKWRRILITNLAAVCCALPMGGATPTLKVEVVLLDLDETVWQADFKGGGMPAGDIHQRAMDLANAGRLTAPIRATLEVPEGPKAKWQQGHNLTFDAGWATDSTQPNRVLPTKKETRFLGTTISAAWTSDPLSLTLSMLHETLSAESTQQVYDTKAVGKERAERSVKMPCFDGVEWTGTLLLKPGEWARAAAILRPGKVAQRFVILIRGGGS